jgi:hypothetical protein
VPHWDRELDGRDDGPSAVFWDVVTCFFAPTALVTEAFRPRYADSHYANDDAPLIRRLAGRERINISPSFGCRCSSRTRLLPFLRHAFHRGTVFVSGHARADALWLPLVVGLFAGSAGCAAASRRYPLATPAAAAAASVAGSAVGLSAQRPEDAPTMAWVAPVYATAHVAGMWRGLFLLVRDRRRT